MCRKQEAKESVPSLQGTEATMAHHRQLMIVACTGIALSWLGSAQADTTPILIELSVDPALINEAALSRCWSMIGAVAVQPRVLFITRTTTPIAPSRFWLSSVVGPLLLR